MPSPEPASQKSVSAHEPDGAPRPLVELGRLSINQKTLDRSAVPSFLSALEANEVPYASLWIGPVVDLGVVETKRLLDEAGVRLSSLCRAGNLTSGTRARADNLRALDMAAELGAECLVVVVGGLVDGSRDLAEARRTAVAELALLSEEAASRGVTLAIEPMHPAQAADRSVLTTLSQALQWRREVERPGTVAIALDSYHVWWDPFLAEDVRASTDAIGVVQIADWATPLTVTSTLQRAMPGDGHIDLASFMTLVDSTGYAGPVEVELFNDVVAAMDPHLIVAELCRRLTRAPRVGAR